MLDGSFTWVFTSVNGPQTRVDKLRMLEELGRVRDSWPGPWCVGGDFNEILYPYERSSGVCPSNAMAEFRNFINQRALMDLPLKGGDFTWSRSGADPVALLDWIAFLCRWIRRSSFQRWFRRGC